jgi:hypothetical protein
MRTPRRLLIAGSVLALAACSSGVSDTATPESVTLPSSGAQPVESTDTVPSAEEILPSAEPQAGTTLTISNQVDVVLPALPAGVDLFDVDGSGVCAAMHAAGVFGADAATPSGSGVSGFNGVNSVYCSIAQPYDVALGDMSTASDVFFEQIVANAALTGEDDPFGDTAPGDQIVLTFDAVNENYVELFGLADEVKNVACAAVGELTGIEGEWSFAGYTFGNDEGTVMCQVYAETGVAPVVADQAAADAWFASNPLWMSDTVAG